MPIPFTIIAFIISIGVGISAFLKGADKRGREQPGTAFFICMLAIVDILLRLDWAILASNAFHSDNMVTFICLLLLIGISLMVNLLLWRRFFYSKYRYEDKDPLFSEYVKKYPAFSQLIIGLSYLLTF